MCKWFGEWEYKVGDYIGAELRGGGYLEGEIKKVINDPQRGIVTIILYNNWRVYPFELQRSGIGDTITKYFSRNEKKTIDDLPLLEIQKRYVLRWLAWKFYDVLLKLKIENGYCKPYDPLTIEDNKYHTYIFGGKGRHFEYKTLREIEEKLVNEMVKILKEESID